MKILLDSTLPDGASYNYKKSDAEQAPEPIRSLLAIQGVKGIYHVMDFMAVERIGNVQWEKILSEVRAVLNEGKEAEKTGDEPEVDEHYGEVYVHVQTYKDIPLQVKVFTSDEEVRFGLSGRFVKAMEKVHRTEVENYILLRKWADYGIRYGDLKEVGEQVVQELEAAYSDERLQELVEKAEQQETAAVRGRNVTLAEFDVPEWEKRFQLLDQMPDPSIDDYAVLNRALEDEKMSIRRLSVVYLGMIEDESVIPYIEKALEDKSWAVRRTAADCMSDLGFTGFERAAIRLLQDKNKLVRWRAAMYLYESGTENALEALHEAENDSEFEVKLQVRMAIARIEEGEEAKGSIWRQMTERNS